MAKDKKPKHDAAAEADQGPAQPPRLKVRYEQEVATKMHEALGIDNPMARPRLRKIVVNINMGRHLEGAKIPANVKDTVLSTLTKISGQKPIVLKAKKSVSNFKVREGVDTAAMVTMRRDRMWHFLDRLISLGIPRIKDFRGMPTDAFDKSGNYTMGLSEQGVFPEIDMANTNFIHGMNINMVFSNSDPKKSRYVLEQLGFPFKKPEGKK